MKVNIFENEEHVGSIILEGDNLRADPADSQLLIKIIRSPIFAMVGEDLVDINSSDDPALFMQNLARHYKSQGLRASRPEEANAEPTDDE